MEYASTNVRLPKEQVKLLKLRAVEEGKSMGKVLREALARGLQGATVRQKKRQLARNNPFSKITGLGASGIPDSAEDHDKYLYGKSKDKWPS